MEGRDIGWFGFWERFERKFLSQAEESMQLEKFISLKQGRLSVKEYRNQFNELSRFGMELVNTPHKKATKFAKGLNQPLHGLAWTHVPMGATYESLVEMALMSDVAKKEEVKEVPKLEKFKKQSWKNKKDKDKKKGGGSQKGLIKKAEKCHNCGMVGHYSKDYMKDTKKGRGYTLSLIHI